MGLAFDSILVEESVDDEGDNALIKVLHALSHKQVKD